jgi:hypothetical protein
MAKLLYVSMEVLQFECVGISPTTWVRDGDT